jgi:galactokinase/mevalonate kinase-like predicted kinase
VAVRVTDCPAVAGLGAATSAVAVLVNAVTVSVKMLDVEVAKLALPE